MKIIKKIAFIFVFMIIGLINVNADEYSEALKKLSDNGEILVKSVRPTNKSEMYYLIGSYIQDFNYDNYEFSVRSCNSNYSECEITVSGNAKQKFKMNYYDTDKNVLEKIEEYSKKIPVGNKYYLEDLELVNYLINTKYRMYQNTYNNVTESRAINYVGKLKDSLGNGNISIEIIPASGDGAPFMTAVGGIVVLSYNGIAYKAINVDSENDCLLNIVKRNIIYVPDDTPDTKEAYIAAANERIEKYLNGKKANITFGGKLSDNFEDFSFTGLELLADYPELFDASKMVDAYYYFNYEGKPIEFLIQKDSSMLQNDVKYKATDIVTDVEISTEDFNIPLDTSIFVDMIKNGTEKYKEIIDKLDINNAYIYDFKLFSSSLDKYISKLENGYFEIKIPVPEEYKGKSLVVYYVKDDGSKENYEVITEGNYVRFKTNHFSVYALAEEKVDVNDNETKNNNTEVPKTNDNLITLIISFIILFISFRLSCKKILNH